jgi:hypothetical protein
MNGEVFMPSTDDTSVLRDSKAYRQHVVSILQAISAQAGVRGRGRSKYVGPRFLEAAATSENAADPFGRK